MVMALPFFTALVGIILAMRGMRMAAIGVWGSTLVIMVIWMVYHMNGSLNVSL